MKDYETTPDRKDDFSGDGAPGIWLQSFCAALSGGFSNPVECADECLRKFRERFGSP